MVNAVGEAFSGYRVVGGANGGYITATLYYKASVPETPARPKPLRNELIALVAGLGLVAAWAIARRRFPPPTHQ